MNERIALSIVVPTIDEASTLPALLSDLQRLRTSYEVVVTDGGSHDATREVAVDLGARVVRSSPSRGRQLQAGAAVATGRVLCFLHADVRLDASACQALDRLAVCCAEGVAYAFELRIADDRWRYRIVERGTACRSRFGGLPYGDQGLILTRATYELAGGFADLSIMEDVAFVRALRRVGRVVMLREQVTVSARRWQRDGVVRGTLRNWLLVLAYFAGISPARLAHAYRPHSRAKRASRILT